MIERFIITIIPLLVGLFVLQMLGLQVNSFVQTRDMDEANNHRDIASKMDIEDIIDVLTTHPVVPLVSRERRCPE